MTRGADRRAAIEPRGPRRAQWKYVDVDIVADAACLSAAIAEVHADGVVCGARHDPHRNRDRLALTVRDLDAVAVLEIAVIGCRLDADVRDVLPRDLRDRLGQLLEPAVIGEPAVENVWIRPEDDLHAGLCRGCGRRRWRGSRRCRRASQYRRAANEAVVQRVTPERLEARERLTAFPFERRSLLAERAR